MVTFTTADYLKLTDGARFNAIPDAAADALLSAAPVAAFGFLGSSPGAITVQGSHFAVAPGKEIALVGGNITVEQGTLDNGTVQAAQLSAPSGRIHLASAASPGEILADPVMQASTPGQLFGTIQISQHSVLDVSGDVGGTVQIRGGQFILDNSTISANTTGSATGSGSNRGEVTISASTVLLENGAAIQSESTTGNAGSITIQGVDGEGSAASAVSLDNAIISATVSGGSAAGVPADIRITGENVTLSNGTHISANTSSAAPAGNIAFNVGTLNTKAGPNRLLINQNAPISDPADKPPDPNFPTGVLIESNSTSATADAGKAGSVTIQGVKGLGAAANSVTLDDATIATTISAGAAGTTPGSINIVADSVALSNNAVLLSISNGEAPAGHITLDVDTLRANVNPDGTLMTGGAVFISSANTTFTSNGGPAGNITISGTRPGPTDTATAVELNNVLLNTQLGPFARVQDESPALGPPPPPNPAGVTITAQSLALSNGTTIVANTGDTRPAGSITFNVETLRSNVAPDGTPIKGVDGVFILSSSASRLPSAGAAGAISISGPAPETTDAAKFVGLDKTWINSVAIGGIPATPHSGITITADTVALTSETGSAQFNDNYGEAGINASSIGGAPAGNIAFNVNTLRANTNPDGSPMEKGYVFISTTNNSVDGTGGPAGTMSISGVRPEATDAAHSVTLHNMAINNFVSRGTPNAPASATTITADALVITGKNLTDRLGQRTGLFATSDGSAPAGNIALNVGSLTAHNAMFSSSSTSGLADAGRAGSVMIQGVGGTGTMPAAVTLDHSVVATEAKAGAGGAIALSGESVTVENAGIVSSKSSGTGPNARGGNITISGNQSVNLNTGGTITASSTGSGDAGNITIHAGNQFLSQHGSITTESTQASGGNVTIIANELVYLSDGQINASVHGATTTTGGNIVIDPNFVILQNSQILAQATQGQGGNISITANTFLSDNLSLVSASSESGVNGTVSVQSPISQAGGKIVPLSRSTLEATALLSQRCAALGDGQYSSFVVVGREALPIAPGGWLASPLMVAASESIPATQLHDLPESSSSLLGMNGDEVVSIRRVSSSIFASNLLSTDFLIGCGS